MSRKLHKGVGFAKVTPASGVAELRSGRKAGGLSWPLGAGQQRAQCGESGAQESTHNQILLIQLLTKQFVWLTQIYVCEHRE